MFFNKKAYGVGYRDIKKNQIIGNETKNIREVTRFAGCIIKKFVKKTVMVFCSDESYSFLHELKTDVVASFFATSGLLSCSLW